MTVQAHIVDGPVTPEVAHAAANAFPGAGAIVEFRGVVRPAEAGEPIDALDYEVYEPMTRRELERLARAAALRHDLIAVRLWHSRGRVGAGECSLWLIVAAERRKAAIAAVDELVDELKREVPIWKRPCAPAGAGGITREEAGRR